jgi:diguanylate cyclase (GGDEF)-like protein/PAS domain S-box-containing protein
MIPRKAARKASGQPQARPQSAGTADLAGALGVLDARRRDTLLEAMAVSARELLRAPDLKMSLPKVAERIGIATGVDRTHIFLIDASDNEGNILAHYFWTTPGAVTPADFQIPLLPLAKAGLKSWIPRLKAGEVIAGHVRNFDPDVRALMERGGVKSALSVPVFADGRWLGLIGFDECRNERDWSQAEIDTIEIAAELIGAAIARTSHLKSLADANRIIESSPTILYRLSPDPPFALTYVSRNVSRYGFDPDALIAHPDRWLSLIDSADRPAMMVNIALLIEGKTDRVQHDFRLRKPDGTVFWFDSEGYALRDPTGKLTGIEGILTDITDRKDAEEKIATLARTDSLTGLPNRAAFLDRLDLAFARAGRVMTQFAVHYIDLDHFKDVNDTLGHPMGDRLLQLVAGRLKRCLRETDMVARFGGDEFAVLQDDVCDPGSIERLADKIGETVSQPYQLGSNQISTSASIGVVPYSRDIANTDAMMMKADLALYRAKNEGRNRFRFHVSALDDETRERMIISEDLRHAVERGELELFYQQQVELASGAIVGLEALIRWNHPRRSLLLPTEFIPIAETSGSIVGIGEWVISQACRQIRDWSEDGIAPPIVAINLSGAQFKLASHMDRIIMGSLDRYSVAPGKLEVELTETVLIEAAQRHGEIFRRLKQAGVRFAIDDFGTGYSSLDYLRSFRLDRIKIDRRFIENVATCADDAAIVRATIGLAAELGIEVLAEGVETAAQREFLIAVGCKFAQGFFFGRPMAAVATADCLRRDRELTAA